jgi:hypothetical protein
MSEGIPEINPRQAHQLWRLFTGSSPCREALMVLFGFRWEEGVLANPAGGVANFLRKWAEAVDNSEIDKNG